MFKLAIVQTVFHLYFNQPISPILFSYVLYLFKNSASHLFKNPRLQNDRSPLSFDDRDIIQPSE